jgi:hypothetical protein
VTFRTSSRFSEASWAARESTCMAKYTLLVRRPQSPKPMTGHLQCSSLDGYHFLARWKLPFAFLFSFLKLSVATLSHFRYNLSLTYMLKRLIVFRPLCNASKHTMVSQQRSTCSPPSPTPKHRVMISPRSIKHSIPSPPLLRKRSSSSDFSMEDGYRKKVRKDGAPIDSILMPMLSNDSEFRDVDLPVFRLKPRKSASQRSWKLRFPFDATGSQPDSESEGRKLSHHL